MWPILLALAGQDRRRHGGGQGGAPSPSTGCAAISLHAGLGCSGEVVVVGEVEAPSLPHLGP